MLLLSCLFCISAFRRILFIIALPCGVRAHTVAVCKGNTHNMLFWSSDEFLFRKNLCKPISSADSSRNSTHSSFYEVKINVSVSSVEMLVISPNFNISFEFAVKMRKIGTLLYYGGSGRHFEAIVCWSLFFVANACLCGSNFPQIGWLRKWEDFLGLACLKNHIQVVFFIKTIWLQTWCLRVKIEYDYIKLYLHQ